MDELTKFAEELEQSATTLRIDAGDALTNGSMKYGQNAQQAAVVLDLIINAVYAATGRKRND